MIPEQNPYNNWNGNGSTTTFDFDFYIENETQLDVFITNAQGVQTKLEYGLDYSINEFKNENGSFIKFPIAGSSHGVLAADEIISLCLTLPISQENPYGKSSYLDLSTLEYSLDYIIRICQIMNRELERSVKTQEGSSQSAEEMIESLNNSVNQAAISAQQAQNYAISAGEEATVATQLSAQMQDLYNEALDEITDIKTETIDACETQVQKAQMYAQQSGSKGMPTDICKNLKIEYDTENRKVKLSWIDPNDTINSLGQILSSWKNTVISYKENSYPSDIDDGTIILTNSVKNQYKNQAYEYNVPENITDITTLKFRAFPCSVNDVYNKDNRNCFDAVEIYEMLFDKTNSNSFGNVRYPQGCRNEYFTPAGMDYEKNIFNEGSWGNSFIMNMQKPCMLYNKAANNIGLNIVGNMNVTSEGNLSGFTTSIYADMPYKPELIDAINSFEICVDFTTGSTVSTSQETILGNSTTNAHSPQLAIISKKLQWDMPNSSYAYIGAMTSTNEVAANTNYISKLIYNKANSLISAYMATNGGTDVKIGEMSVSSIGWNEVIRMGLDLLASPFNGTINIKGCYIKANEELVFDGSKYKCLLGDVMEYLNPNDCTKTIDGENSHVADENSPANAMVEWDVTKTWIKIEEYLPGKYHAYFANKKVDNGYKNYLQYNKNGDIVEKYYHMMYDPCNVKNIIRSLSGKTPCVNTAGNLQIDYAKNNGKGHDACEARFVLYRHLLLMLLGKSTDTQSVFGKGRNSGGTQSSYNQLTSGVLNQKGAFWGDNDNGAVKVFHTENPWGNVWNIMQGIIQINGKLYIKLTPNINDGSTAEDYNTTGEGYIDTGITLSGTSGGYISDLELYDNCVFLPKTASGSSSTYTPDGLWWDASLTGLARVGGSSANGLLCGSFALAVHAAASPAIWDYGASLSYTPS